MQFRGWEGSDLCYLHVGAGGAVLKVGIGPCLKMGGGVLLVSL